jgi:hypothetical protein
MKVISLLQPWASLVVMGAKKIETRSWNTKFRGPLLIHASKKFTNEQISLGQKFNAEFGVGLGFIDELPTGAIIGQVELVHTVQSNYCFEGNVFEWETSSCMFKYEITKQEIAFGDYSNGRYGWMLHKPVEFKVSIPAKGSLSLWDFEDVFQQLPKL